MIMENKMKNIYKILIEQLYGYLSDKEVNDFWDFIRKYTN